MTREETRRNPTMTIEMTAAGITVVGVFREGRIDRGGSVTKVHDPDGRSTRWQGQTARRNDLGIGPVYTGGDEAKCLLATLKELDQELRDGWKTAPPGRGGNRSAAGGPAGPGRTALPMDDTTHRRPESGRRSG